MCPHSSLSLRYPAHENLRDLEGLEAEAARLSERVSELGILPSAPGAASRQPSDSAPHPVAGEGDLIASSQDDMMGTKFLPSPPGNEKTGHPTVDWGNFGELTGSRTVRNSGLPPLEYNIKRMVWAATTVNGHLPRESRLENALLADLDLSHNSARVGPAARRYLELYFNTFADCLPFLDPRRTRAQLEAAAKSDSDPSSSSPILLMALSLGAIVSPGHDQRSSFHSSTYLLAAIKGYSQALAPDSLDLLHFLLLLTLYSLFSPHGGSTWHLLGLAIQTALRLGLHQESRLDKWSSGKHDGYNAFWCTYILDRQVL